MSDPLSLRLAEARELNKKQFMAKYPHPWLVSELIKLAQPARPGLNGPIASTGSMSVGDRRFVATKLSAAALQARPESFVLFPIAKSDRNLWADRILLGRADNNDIVMDDQSVSKAHAYFFTKWGRLQVVAYPTVNPTKLNGAVLQPHGSGVHVPEDAILEFGMIGCRLIEGASLYAMLAGRS